MMNLTHAGAKKLVFVLSSGGVLGLAAACGWRTGLLDLASATSLDGGADALAPARDTAVEDATAVPDAIVPPVGLPLSGFTTAEAPSGTLPVRGGTA